MPPISTRTHAVAGAAATGAALLLRRFRVPTTRWLALLAIGVGELVAAVVTKRRPALTAGSEPTTPWSPPSPSGAPAAAAPVAPPPIETPGAPAAATPVAPPPIETSGAPATATPVAPPPIETPGAPATAAPVAPPPLETPGPSVTPPHEPQSDVERAEEVDAGLPHEGRSASGDVFVAQQEAAAAAEAAAIGGHVARETGDPAMAPVYEAGGGEQEGWEAAEGDLIESASHGESAANPERDALTPEVESDRSSAVYGEADEEHSTEVEDTDR